MPLEDRIRQAVRERRRTLGWSQSELARRARLEQRQISLFESGAPGGDLRLSSLARLLSALGIEAALAAPQARRAESRLIDLSEYPALRLLAWNRSSRTLTEEEALALYEANWRHVGKLDPREQALVRRLVRRHGKGVLHV